MPRHDMTNVPMTRCAGCTSQYAETALFCPNCGTPKARDVASASDPLIGKVLGERFQILELLGHGASGTIYRAEHVTLRRKVAIKVLHNELSRDDLAVERFRREATTVAEIDNEHIVEIHDFGRTNDGRLYLAMELLEGETLDHVLAREKTLSVEKTADILIQVGEALMEAHAIGYVHRDLRPRNVYLAVRRGKANFVKLLDFGLAKLVETDAQAASTSLGMTFGDPRYMSPEQARGDRIDRRADIYQLGCVAYEMLTGQPPFTGNRVFDILSKQVTEIPQPLPTRRPGVPLWVEASVAKMLAKDPENRFATTTRMVEALRLGLETGQIMEDEIARRRESIPPPSVSRVMMKMGLSAPIDPAARSESAPLHDGPPLPALLGKETLKGHLEPQHDESSRRRTGTPQLGVPVQPPVAGQIDPRPPSPAPVMPSAPVYVAPPSGPIAVPGSQTVLGYTSSATSAPAPAAAPVMSSQTAHGYSPALSGPPQMPPPLASQEQAAALAATAPSPTIQTPIAAPPPAPVAPVPVAPAPNLGAAVVIPAPLPPVVSAPSGATGRSKRSSSQLGPGDSSAWFDDGDAASEEAEGVRARKLISPSTTDLSLYDEPLPLRRRWPMVVAILGGLALVGGIAFALTRGDDKPAANKQEAVATAPTPLIDVPPSQIITPEGSGAAVPTPGTNAIVTPGKTLTPANTGTPRRPSGGTTTPRTNATNTNPDDTASRRPGQGGAADWFGGGTTTTTPAVTDTPPTTTPTTTPPTTTPTTTPGVSGTDGPVDPYGGGADAPPADNASPDKKAEFFANLGKTQLIQGDTAGAASSFKKALELDAKNIPAIIGMGEIALRQGLFGDAIAHLKKASRLAPRSSHVFTLLGEAYLGTGNNAVAADQFKKALQLDPDNTRAREGFNEAQSRVPPAEDD